MKLAMSFKDYVKFLKGFSNAPLTLNRLTLPFGVISGSTASDSLLVGHVLDDLASRFEAHHMVDCIDVAAAAYDLGHEPAGAFLDEAPMIMSRMAQDMGVVRIH